MIQLTTIKQKAGPAAAGTNRLFILPWQYLESIPAIHPVDQVIYEDIVRKTGPNGIVTSFMQYDFTPGKCRLSAPSKGSDGNAYFETLLDVSIAGDEPQRLAQFQSMINGLFIAVLDQASGSVKLAGSELSPLLCRQVSYDAGSGQGDFNGTVFQFRSKGTVPVAYAGGVGITAFRVKEDSVYCVTE